MSDAPSWSHWIAVRLYERRWVAFIGGLLLTAAAIPPALQVDVDTSVQNWFTEGDPALEAYRDFQETYGNDEVVLIALRDSSGVLTPDGLSMLQSATERIQSVEGVASVTSLATQTQVHPTVAGPRLVPLVGEDSLTSRQAAALKKRVLSDSSYGRLISADGTTTALFARMARNSEIDGRRGGILDSIRTVLHPFDASVHLAGTGVILDAINEAATEDSFLFILVSSLLMYVLLWGYFRRIGPVVLTLAVVGMATTWLMGLYGLTGHDISMVTVVMPTLVMVVCTADCVHLLVYAADLPDTLSPRKRTIHTLRHLATPCLVTTLTTTAGFASLTTSSMAIVRTLGLFSAIGVIAGLVAAFVLCTLALPYDDVLPTRPDSSWLTRFVDAIAGLGVRRWRPILVATGMVVLAAAGGLTFIQADTNPIGYLFSDHPVRQDSEVIEDKLGPYTPLEFVVRSDSSVLDPALLHAVRRWQERAVSTGMVRWHHSAVDDLRRLRGALPGRAETLPRSREQLAGLLRLGEDRRPYLAALRAHPDQLRVTFGMPITSADGIRRTIDSVRAAADLPSTAQLEATGYLPLYVRMMALLTESLATSFGLALLVILTVIAMIFRSMEASLLSLVPNGLPVLVSLGLMGWMSIPLDAATLTIAAVIFGLVVDDTIHLLHAYMTRSSTAPPLSAIRSTVRTTGRRMAITTTVLAGGFLVLCLAQIKSIVWLGLLSAVAIVVAVAADLVVLPAILAAVNRSPQPEPKHNGVAHESVA